MLTKPDIKYTIGVLAKAGKRFPRDSIGCQMNINDIVDVWHHAFQEVALPVWQRATVKALTMTEARGLDLNVINTALMQEAVKRAEDEQFRLQRKEDEALKKADILKDAEDSALSRPLRIAMRWTRRRLQRHQIPFNIPGKDKAWKYGRHLGMTAKEIEEQNILIRIYLADCEYSRARERTPGYGIYLGSDRLLHAKKEAMA